MKRMLIYEPAMCCSTGVCGVGIDAELLRITNAFGNLQKNGISVGRYNLSSAPQVFVSNKEINQLLNEKGVDCLPITTVDGAIVKMGSYPTDQEIVGWLQVSENMLGEIKVSASEASMLDVVPCCPEGSQCL